MSKLDGRKVSHSLREAIRIEAIQKWKDGETVQNLSKEYGTDTSCIYRWIGRYRKGGMKARKNTTNRSLQKCQADARATEGAGQHYSYQRPDILRVLQSSLVKGYRGRSYQDGI